MKALTAYRVVKGMFYLPDNHNRFGGGFGSSCLADAPGNLNDRIIAGVLGLKSSLMQDAENIGGGGGTLGDVNGDIILAVGGCLNDFGVNHLFDETHSGLPFCFGNPCVVMLDILASLFSSNHANPPYHATVTIAPVIAPVMMHSS